MICNRTTYPEITSPSSLLSLTDAEPWRTRKPACCSLRVCSVFTNRNYRAIVFELCGGRPVLSKPYSQVSTHGAVALIGLTLFWPTGKGADQARHLGSQSRFRRVLDNLWAKFHFWSSMQASECHRVHHHQTGSSQLCRGSQSTSEWPSLYKREGGREGSPNWFLLCLLGCSFPLPTPNLSLF